MGPKRYFTQGAIGSEIRIEGAEFNHMANVMRAKAGQEVVLCNGDGFDCLCRIEEIGKREARLSLVSRTKNLCETRAEATAFVGLLKGDNTELEVQKLSELGVRRIVPFFSENTVAKADKNKIERLRRVALESAKQCGRAYVARVEEAIPFREIFGETFDALLFCCEFERERSVAEALSGLASGARVGFVVGSEGGFTAEEAAFAERSGAIPLSLGPRILRAETAAIAAASVLMYALGEMRARV